MEKQVIVDTETTSIWPDYDTGAGVIWEFAVIERGPDGRREHLWRVKPNLAIANPAALAVGRYYERTKDMLNPVIGFGQYAADGSGCAYDLAGDVDRDGMFWSNPQAVADIVAPMLDHATLIGATPSFEDRYLRAFLQAYGHAGTWNYRLRDIGSIAYGYLRALEAGGDLDPLQLVPPIGAGAGDFARELRIDLDKFDPHTALGDCQLVETMLDLIEAT